MTGLLASNIDPSQWAWAQQSDPAQGQAAPQAQPVPAQGGYAGIAANLAPPPQPPATDPYAGIAPMLQTPTQALQAQARLHPWVTALKLIGGTLGQMGGDKGAVDAARADLIGQANEPLQLAQARARIAGMQQMFAALPPDQKVLFLQDPQGFTDQMVKNLELQRLRPGQGLANAEGPAFTQQRPGPAASFAPAAQSGSAPGGGDPDPLRRFRYNPDSGDVE
ncbi:MAG TPA: hypothetical protein VHZ26_15030 [Caulobacteraceae bacterium]|jgi:hypothetical protein|nr:hypothetical protein [Caulobacteraceae bacterium]